MEKSTDKQWASKYLLDPLNSPEPSAETGPGTHFRASHGTTTPASSKKPTPSVSVRSSEIPTSEQITPNTTGRSSNNPYRNGTSSYHSSPKSTNPRTERFPNFDGSHHPQRPNVDIQNPKSSRSETSGRHRRTSSLSKRYEGDNTHRPLNMLKHDAKSANRAPHLRKKHTPGADSIDRLGGAAGAYHHEGPYDATLLARNTSFASSPLEAVAASNEEALRATPREMIKDSVDKHRPLDGVASVPPGMTDQYGRTYEYQEGTDMMRQDNAEGGAYKRWGDVKYLPEDLKGKGEPSYSVEKALRDHKSHGRNVSESGIEMATPAEQRRPVSAETGPGPARPLSDGTGYAGWEQGVRRSESGAGKLRKRFGSLKIKNRS